MLVRQNCVLALILWVGWGGGGGHQHSSPPMPPQACALPREMWRVRSRVGACGGIGVVTRCGFVQDQISLKSSGIRNHACGSERYRPTCVVADPGSKPSRSNVYNICFLRSFSLLATAHVGLSEVGVCWLFGFSLGPTSNIRS